MRFLRFVRFLCPASCFCVLTFASPAAMAFWPLFGKGIDYAIHFDGADTEMQAWFATLSLDKKNETDPPEDLDALDGEASSLADKVKKALAAKGYMEAVVEPSLDVQAKPPAIRLTIEQGTRYPLGAIHTQWQGAPLMTLDMDALKSRTGKPLDMEAIEADALTLQTHIAKDHCLLSLSVTPKLRLYSATRSAELVFEIAHGREADFGEAVIAGNKRVKDSVIHRAIAWKQGECYQVARVNSTRTSLIDSQLFSTIDIVPAEAPGPDGRVPMHITVHERVARSIGGGVEYSTDKGFGIYGNWEHRNLLGEAEKLTTNLTLAERQQALKGVFRVPGFLRDDQTLVLSSSVKHESLDAYEALTFDNSAGIERRLAPHLKGGLGVGYTLSQTDDALTGRNNYALLSFPGFVEYDTRSDIMDPKRGVLGQFSATPYTETIGDGGQFLKLRATGQHYLSSDTLPLKPTFASRLSLGAIYGGKGDNIPADIRYYAGGGGSVRGYSYQSLSPYYQGEPIGGASMLEASGELRLRFTEEFGGVLFMDAGNGYASSTPDLSEKLYVGAGTGIRYYSPIGPLRFDIAFPLNGEDIGEDTYQFYVSLGQAF